MTKTQFQPIVIIIWLIFTIYLINRGGRNNGIFRIVVQSGVRLIFLGALAAAEIKYLGSSENTFFTEAATNTILILSASIGANYISHANMSLRDSPNKSEGPEKIPSWLTWLTLFSWFYGKK